jgi:hypothetical protein
MNDLDGDERRWDKVAVFSVNFIELAAPHVPRFVAAESILFAKLAGAQTAPFVDDTPRLA